MAIIWGSIFIEYKKGSLQKEIELLGFRNSGLCQCLYLLFYHLAGPRLYLLYLLVWTLNYTPESGFIAPFDGFIIEPDFECWLNNLEIW